MQTLAKLVLEHAAGLPEGTPLAAKELLHLGSRAAVDQVLSRLVRRGTLLRAGRGIYVRPVESLFGTRSPSTVKMVEKVYPSDANFLLAKVKDAKSTYNLLVTKGIITRDRSNVALCENCLRITVGTPAENIVLLDELKKA